MKSSSRKRRRGHSDIGSDIRPLKKHCHNNHDLDWLKDEIHDMKREISSLKECITAIGELLKEEVNFNLSEIVYLLRKLSSL